MGNPSRNKEITGPLKEVLRRISGNGPITFAKFMEIALYWSDEGYYASERDHWGKDGDYVTSLDKGPVFSRLIARQIHEMWQILGCSTDFSIIEAGAGRGLLAFGILSAIKKDYPHLYEASTVHIIEKNPHLRKPSEKICWHEDLSEHGPDITGCILSNELIDALPFHRLVKRTDELKEIYTGLEHGRLVDIEDSPSTDAFSRYFTRIGIEPRMDYKIEVSLNASEWIRDAGKVLKQGFVMTIDYGLPAADLFSRFPEGTLMCHKRHITNDDPYRDIGGQDITAHVDFTSFVNYGKEAGLIPTGFTTQHYFLMGLGILSELCEVRTGGLDDIEAMKNNQMIKELIMPGGMGDTFKVLVQHKGIERPDLMGFSVKDMLSAL
ncbi:MAG: SAM-dependent methyltransferase [Deltaproteobacteria bacterium]|nr:SAM-dependent methyltransferase [Deltaproteobacteria bacterium]